MHIKYSNANLAFYSITLSNFCILYPAHIIYDKVNGFKRVRTRFLQPYNYKDHNLHMQQLKNMDSRFYKAHIVNLQSNNHLHQDSFLQLATFFVNQLPTYKITGTYVASCTGTKYIIAHVINIAVILHNTVLMKCTWAYVCVCYQSKFMWNVYVGNQFLMKLSIRNTHRLHASHHSYVCMSLIITHAYNSTDKTKISEVHDYVHRFQCIY